MSAPAKTCSIFGNAEVGAGSRVEKPIEDVERATITPWFGEKGLGVQYKLPTSVEQQLFDKALKEKSDEFVYRENNRVFH